MNQLCFLHTFRHTRYVNDDFSGLLLFIYNFYLELGAIIERESAEREKNAQNVDLACIPISVYWIVQFFNECSADVDRHFERKRRKSPLFFFCRFADILNSLEGPELAYMYELVH